MFYHVNGAIRLVYSSSSYTSLLSHTHSKDEGLVRKKVRLIEKQNFGSGEEREISDFNSEREKSDEQSEGEKSEMKKDDWKIEREGSDLSSKEKNSEERGKKNTIIVRKTQSANAEESFGSPLVMTSACTFPFKVPAPLPFRSVEEIPMSSLKEIGTTVQLIDLLRPLNDYTFVIHAVECEDRGA